MIKLGSISTSNDLSHPLSIFVHRASECLTDHESHGDGLICFSLLNGLAERGHEVHAFANTAPIRKTSPRLHVKTARHRVPANSLASWEYSWRADQWLREVERDAPVDLVWRMHPYGAACPSPPKTGGRPLVVGPLFYGWPDQPGTRPTSGQPRFGVGLQGLVRPLMERGWHQTLQAASLIFCATEPHTAAIQTQYPQAVVKTLPVIVTPPDGLGTASQRGPEPGGPVTLLFVANLVPYKNPDVFIEMVALLRQSGVDAQGIILGDGPERERLQAQCTRLGMDRAICFVGKVPNAEVYRRVSEADFLVSLSQGEPYGRGITEAMSVGTPAVCHRSGGPTDFIKDGEDGLLVDELTADAYATRIQSALRTPDNWGRLSVNATRKAEGWRSDVVLSRLEENLYAVVRDGKKL